MKIDIRTKLQSNERPVITIADGIDITVTSDAMSLLEAMEAMDGESQKPSDILNAVRALFAPEDIEKIKSAKLDVAALMVLLTESVNAAMGGTTDEKN